MAIFITKAIVRVIISIAVIFLVLVPACGKIRAAFFSDSDSGQVVAGLLNPVEGGECLSNFDDDHKAVDIIAVCGTPVKASCDGRLGKAGPGLSGDSVFGGTRRGGEKGLLLNNLENCRDDANDWLEHRIFYGCIDTNDFSTRSVKQGDIIGTVGQCENHEEENERGCHIHFVLVKGRLGGDDSEGNCDFLHGDPD